VAVEELRHGEQGFGSEVVGERGWLRVWDYGALPDGPRLTSGSLPRHGGIDEDYAGGAGDGLGQFGRELVHGQPPQAFGGQIAGGIVAAERIAVADDESAGHLPSHRNQQAVCILRPSLRLPL